MYRTFLASVAVVAGLTVAGWRRGHRDQVKVNFRDRVSRSRCHGEQVTRGRRLEIEEETEAKK